MSDNAGRSGDAGAIAGVDASPKIVSVALEVDVEQRVLEADGVVVAPSLEVLGVCELDRLVRSQSAPGNIFSFDIETSRNALQEEPDYSPPAFGAQGSSAVRHCPVCRRPHGVSRRDSP
jgi:hypothetical protein